MHPARVIQEDLRKAGVEIITAKGKLDFHACRKAYINLVIATGADVKTAQALSRHSTPYLTMEVYGEAVDTRLINTAEMVGKMISQASGEKGTNGPDTQKWPKSAQVPEMGCTDKTATPCSAKGCCDEIWYRRVELNKALQNIDLDKECRNKTSAGHEALHLGQSQEYATMYNVEAATLMEASPAPHDTLQTTDLLHPLHLPDTSKAVENALNELVVVIGSWPRLPDSMRKGIVAMVTSFQTENDRNLS